MPRTSSIHLRLALLLPAMFLATVLAACGGRSDSLAVGDDGPAPDGQGIGIGSSGGNRCLPAPCPSGAPWNPTLCACELADDGGSPILEDAGPCPDLMCPDNTYFEIVNGQCLCAAYPDFDAPIDTYDAPDDAPQTVDAPYPYDAPYYSYDAPYSYDSPIYQEDSPYYYCNLYCGPGSQLDYNSCTCVSCPTVCPLGSMPSYNCGSCTPCSACPAGFEQTGPNCGCVPDGVTPPPTPPEAGPDGGGGCTLEGYYSCALGSWCALGTCPGSQTQYGCYCNTDGTTTCNLSCPAPPACQIPGLGSCASGASCVYGQCDGDAGSLLYCSCEYGGSAYCDTIPCSETVMLPEAGPAADAGPSCNLEGYTQCPVGSYCQLGTCPGGSSYGCICNADGTTACDLACPPPGPCTIPGEGTCPYGQSCTFGSCSNGTGAQLVCFCESNGQASCYSSGCADN